MTGVLAFVGTQTQAAMFDITFTSNQGTLDGVGQINGVAVGPGAPGVYEAIVAGSFFDVFATVDGFAPGIYSLIPNPNAPNSSYSPSGYFIYDNLVANGGNPFITNPGLLFSGPGVNSLELNLFSNGASSPVPNGTYQLYDNRGVNVYGEATISAVPETSTIFAGALMLLPLGVSATRIMRKNRMA